MKRLEAEWQSYRLMVVPPDAGDIQISETRKAFFGGATAIFELIMKNLDDDSDDCTEKDFTLLSSLQQEIHKYKEQVTKGLV